MAIGELLAWQWSGYPKYHVSRANLVLHIVVVPFFLLGNVALVVGLVLIAPLPAIAGAAATSFGTSGHVTAKSSIYKFK
ncbi:MAG: hypothetical protein PHH58_14370 [Rhodoferax sp.]|nr:hypothetical protein [Rhodoferax sp.]